MENTNKGKFKNIAIGILIAIGFYCISSIVGSMVNVFISIAAGYRKYSDFMNNVTIAGFLAVTLVGMVNHVFTGRLTVCIMSKYGRKHNCITKWFFRCAAISIVVLAITVYPILFSRAPGWLMCLTHSLSILLFGRIEINKHNNEQASAAAISKKKIVFDENQSSLDRSAESVNFDPVFPGLMRNSLEERDKYEVDRNLSTAGDLAKHNGYDNTAPSVKEPNQENTTIQQIEYCRKCGSKLNDGAMFCHRCGTKI